MTLDGKREAPMNSTPTPKAAEPHDALTVSADERLANAYEQIARADEELTRVSEQVAKMERDATRPPSDGPRPQSPPGRPQRRALVGLLLAACIVVAALALQSSYGAGASWRSPVGRRSSLQLPHCRRKIRRFPRSPRHPPFKWPRRRPHHRKQCPSLRPHRKAPHRQRQRRFPITTNCCKQWRAISRMWSEASSSSGRTSSK